MFIIKLIVFLFCIINVNICYAEYCEICANHTLCLYNSSGPNSACELYDVNALLTESEIDEIVNRINERRNFIAMGLSSFMPQAANMKKIVWSPELATIAQRWVDQCDSTIQPDKEDHCRDLANTTVGQNIATIFGPTPGRHVKSFVELWFIPILKYRGNVSYYNQSKAHGTDYFTQLIWAETEFVGCGKAKFFITQRNISIERLVCNFAPQGNIHGKPIYAIGYPSTQCPNYMIPDRAFRGLCTQQRDKIAQKLSTSFLPVTSLLRIVNLSNNSMKQEIDPLRNYLKQINFNTNKTNERRNQKMRHVFFNNTYGGVKRIPSLESRNSWNIETNHSNRQNNPIEKGHSRVYHGYDPRQHSHETHTHNYESYNPNQNNNKDEFRRYAYTTQNIKINTDSDLRKHYGSPQCTRKEQATERNGLIKERLSNICTRGEQSSIRALPISCSPTVCDQYSYIDTHKKSLQCNECPCVKQTKCTPNPKHCGCNNNCGCIRTEDTIPCQNVLSAESSVTVNYGFFPNKVFRSGDQMSTPENLSPIPWILSSSITKNPTKIFNRRRKYDENYKQVKSILENPTLNLQDFHYFDSYFDSSERRKRELERQSTFKPFWQMEGFNNKKPSELRSIRYTTLGIRKNRKSKRTTYARNTESITMSLKQFPTSNSYRNHVTEKYLSFEELMRLRKMTSTDRELDIHRRVGNDNVLKQGTTTTATTQSATTTSEYTTNTPFVRKKHCTRKLTCTWTAFAITGADGSNINNLSGSLDRGSRTPPGYVEGCSRTSTCTREFMDRNQMASITEDELSSSGYGSNADDEDYCERRSLNVRRRDSDGKSVIVSNTDHEAYTSTRYPILSNTDFEISNSCPCNTEFLNTERQKRQIGKRLLITHDNINNFDGQKKVITSYNELFYTGLGKIIKNWFPDMELKSSIYCSSSTNTLKNETYLIVTLMIFISMSN